MREYPAYARAIASLMMRGLKPMAVAVMLSDRFWNYYNHVPKVCIRSEEWEIGRWEFGYLRGRHVVALFGDCTERQFGELLIEIQRIGPSNIWAYDLPGNKLFGEDGDSNGLAFWVWELLGRKIPFKDPLITVARERYQAAVMRAAQDELDTFELLQKRSGLEAAVMWHAENFGRAPDRVRKLFAAPFQESGESVAA